ncbi:MAG: LptA/OstA family protein [Nitrospirota bacterium]|jgi:lipopolysaccharide export system protein LptA
MSKRLFFNILLAFLLAGSLNPAGASAESRGESLLGGPIVITAATLSADAKSNTAVFEGSVVAKTDEMTLKSEKMTVYYGQEGDIEKIRAEGGTELLKGDRTLTSERAEYIAMENRIIFTGKPMAVEGPNVITGSKIIFIIDEDRSIVHDSKVYIDQGNTR